MPGSSDAPRARRLPETTAVGQLRRAVRDWLRHYRSGGGPVAVALSGGADSLALTAAAVAEARAVRAVVVDHGLQANSAEVAAQAAETARMLGCESRTVVRVRVAGAGGMEAAAREARYRALRAARDGLPVLLGHTLDDQAETVLLGLARGSGSRSIQGMAAYDSPWGRPLLGIRREVTRQCCEDLGLDPYDDPHNISPEFTRVRVRSEVLPLLEQVLGGGVAPALARTAHQLQQDNACLDALAADLVTAALPKPVPAGHELSCAVLAAAPAALRTRAVRAWLLAAGVGTVIAPQIQAIDALLVAWRGQGPVAVSGGDATHRLVVRREHGRLTLARHRIAREGNQN